MKVNEDVNARVHIFAATALGRDRVASPTRDSLYPGKATALILQEAAWVPGPGWKRKTE